MESFKSVVDDALLLEENVRNDALLLEEKVRKERQVLANSLNRALKEVLSEIFNKNENLFKITAAFYTPYFNDGDECVYRLHGMYFYTTDNPEMENYVCDYSNSELHNNIHKDLSKLEHSLKSILEVVKVAYGDHVEIVYIRDSGLQINEYEHD